MARRRSFGRLFRRRKTTRDATGAEKVTVVPGFYARVRSGGREVTRYAGPDRETALAYVARLAREEDRLELLGERPACPLAFETFADTYLSFARRTMTDASNLRRGVGATVCPRAKARADARSA